MKNPCAKECPDRSPTCHSECEKYTAFAEERAEKRATMMKENEVVGYDYYKTAMLAKRRRRR